jgi:transcription antitermination factor NusG
MSLTAFQVHRRRDDAHQGWEHSMRASALAVGQSVYITSGPLAGLQGLLTSQAQDGKWVMELAEAGRGVLVCIGGHQLSRT